MYCNIFVIFSRYQAKAVAKILFSEVGGAKNIIVTTVDVNDMNLGCEVYEMVPLKSMRCIVKEIANKERKLIFNKIYKETSDCKSVKVYIPHYASINANFVANSLFEKRDVVVNIIPDGLLSFYEYQLTLKNYIQQFKNKIVSKIIGLDYRMFFNSYVNPFDRVSTIFTYNKELTASYGKQLVELPIDSREIDDTYVNFFIVGNNEYREQHFRHAEKIVEYIEKNNNGAVVYFKKHPTVTLDEMQDYIGEKLSSKLYIIENNEVVEDLIDIYKVRHVLSFAFSTANIEVQALYKSGLNSYIYDVLGGNHKYAIEFKKIRDYYNIKEL